MFPRRLAPIGAFVAFAAVVAACASPAPTSVPTEPPPTQSPVQASPNPNLVAFETHVRESTTKEGQLIRDLAAAQTGSQDQQRQIGRASCRERV